MSQEQSWGLGVLGGQVAPSTWGGSSEDSLMATLAVVLSMLRGWHPQPAPHRPSSCQEGAQAMEQGDSGEAVRRGEGKVIVHRSNLSQPLGKQSLCSFP